MNAAIKQESPNEPVVGDRLSTVFFTTAIAAFSPPIMSYGLEQVALPVYTNATDFYAETGGTLRAEVYSDIDEANKLEGDAASVLDLAGSLRSDIPFPGLRAEKLAALRGWLGEAS